MATYAAVVSLMHLMEQIQVYNAQYCIFNDKKQKQLESLNNKVNFVQEFLESYYHEDSDDAQSLASRIVDAAYAAEDFIVDDINRRERGKGNKYNKVRDASLFSNNLRKLIESFESTKREILEIKKTSKMCKGPHPKEPEQAGSFGGLLNIEKDTVVGFDEIFSSIMKKLTVRQSNLQVCSITGMGGSGKSTLAKKVYDDRVIKQHFDVCGWVTVSQEFNVEKVLLGLLRETGFPMYQIEKKNFDYNKFGELLHKHLSGRRFFVIIDDIWSLEAWDRIKLFLQDSNNGSRILLTTRLVTLANDISPFQNFQTELFDEIQSWNLLCKKVFGKESCPPQLEEVGKVIARNCKGLPLSLVVIGGLLRKSINREYWEYIVEDTNASINLENNERCLKILYTSYHHLPIHLKPCFLHLGVFPEDHEIRVNELIKLWVAERFLKPNKAKSLEEVAIDYVKNLIGRNLIFVSELGSTGKVKHCKVHDLLRDLCLREATKKRFLFVTNALKLEISQGCNNHRRLALCGEKPYWEHSRI